MPKLKFGDKASFDRRAQYLELKNKNDSIHVRFLDGPVYDGKHFLQQTDGKWNVSDCPRIMGEENCPLCEKYFEAKKAAKELGDTKILEGEAKKTYDTLQKEARKYNATISFYYPVLDREVKKAVLFKTGLSTRTFLDGEYSDGIQILDYDYKITRLKQNNKDKGKDWYKFTRLDSVQTEEFFEEEQVQIDLADGWDLESMVYGTKGLSQDMGEKD